MRFVLLVAALAACHRAPGPAAPANKAPAPDYAAAANDELAFLPIDSDLVLGFNIGELRRSPMWQTFKPQLDAFARAIQDPGACGNIDFTQLLERATFGLKMRSRRQFSAVLVMRGAETQRGFDCTVAETKRKGGTATVDRGVTLLTRPDMPELTVATMIVGSTMVMQFDPSANHDSLFTLLGAGSPLRGSPTFMKMYERRERGAAAWGIANGSSPLFEELATNKLRPKAIDGTIVVGGTLNAAVRLTMGSPTEADALAREIGKAKGMAASYTARFDVALQGPIAEVRIELTEAQIRAMVGMLGGMGP